MNAGKVSLLRSQSDARGFIDKTRTLSTIICKKIFHWEEAMLRRCSRFVAVTSSAFLSLCASAPAQSTGAPGGKAPPKLVLFMVIDGLPQAREYQQTRRPLSAQPVHGRRARRHSLCQDPRHQASALAHGIVGTAANQDRRHRTGQQDGAHGLGHDGQGRTLQGARRACGVNQIASDIRRDVKVGRANST